MSAICAIRRYDGRPVDASAVRPMLAAMKRWGEPSAWAPEHPVVALGALHHPATPEDFAERTPIHSTDGTIALVADARIDNREDLAARLGIARTRALIMPDSHYVLAAYEAWGDDFAKHLLGDFAIALWDARRRALILARDHLGRRVLFLHRSPAFLAVASSIRGLLAYPGVPHALDERKVAEFLVLLEDEASTFYEGILRVPPAHLVLAGDEGIRTERFWSLEYRPVRLGSDQAYLDGFLDVFGAAVRSRLRTHDEVAAMVSGGLDSSSVAGMAATVLAEEGRRLIAFHAAPRPGFEGSARKGWIVDESADVRALAEQHANIDLRVLRPDGRTPLDAALRTFSILGSPVRNPINMPWVERIWESAQAAGAGVLLTGQKGNATISFTGYRSLRELVRARRWGDLWREVGAIGARSGRRPRAVLLDDVLLPMLPPAIQSRIARLRGVRPRPLLEVNASAIHPAFAQAMQVEERARAKLMDEWNRRHADAFLYRSLMLTAGGDGPDFAQAFRGWFGLEARDPTSDVRVVDYCLGIPGDQYLRGGEDRRLVRHAMRPYLPGRVLEKTVRGAQASDWYEQFQPLQRAFAAWLDRFEASETARRCLDLARLRRLVDEWPTPLRNEHLQEYSFVLMRGVAMGMFIVWFEEGGLLRSDA